MSPHSKLPKTTPNAPTALGLFRFYVFLSRYSKNQLGNHEIMKTKNLLRSLSLSFTLFACFAGASLRAQTNSVPPAMPGGQLVVTNAQGGVIAVNDPNPATSLGSLGQVGQAAFAFLSDAEPYFGSSNAVQYTAVALYNNNHVGGLVAIGLPLTALSSSGQISFGSALAYIDHQWLSLSLNATAGTTWDVPVIGKVYTAIGSGPDYNWHAHTPGAYSFAEIFKGWDVGGGHVFSVLGGIGYESSMTGAIYNGGFSLSW